MRLTKLLIGLLGLGAATASANVVRIDYTATVTAIQGPNIYSLAVGDSFSGNLRFSTIFDPITKVQKTATFNDVADHWSEDTNFVVESNTIPNYGRQETSEWHKGCDGIRVSNRIVPDAFEGLGIMDCSWYKDSKDGFDALVKSYAFSSRVKELVNGTGLSQSFSLDSSEVAGASPLQWPMAMVFGGWRRERSHPDRPYEFSRLEFQFTSVRVTVIDHGLNPLKRQHLLAPDGSIKTLPLSDPKRAAGTVGTLSPESGTWGAFVRVNGPDLGSAQSARVSTFPGDDESKPATMSQSVTVVGRHGADEIEIQIPANPAGSGWSAQLQTEVVRVYLTMPGKIAPVLAGRYTIIDTSAVKAIDTTRTLPPPDLIPRPAGGPQLLLPVRVPDKIPPGLQQPAPPRPRPPALPPDGAASARGIDEPAVFDRK